MAEEIVILKKINKLEQLKVSPNLYKLNSNNMDEDGELDGVYKGNTLLGSKRNVAPTWDTLKDQWAFDGDIEDLKRIQSRLKLRDEDGRLIEISEDSLSNRHDAFWGHKTLWNSRIMDEGSTSLNSKNPLDELLIRVHRGNSFVKSGSEQSPYVLAESSLELVSPRAEIEAQNRGGKKQVKANVLLDKMGLEKMNCIAYLMQLPGYRPDEKDSEILFNLLLNNAVNNLNKVFKYGAEVTYQDRFIELAEMHNDKLNILTKVQTARDRGGIVARSNGYTFNGDPIEGGSIRTEKQLHDYYLNMKNVEARNELENYLTSTDDLFKK